jgi:predicted AAA+ superfamily ATPase
LNIDEGIGLVNIASYRRPLFREVLDGTKRRKKLIHIITGPRQVGKTTTAQQIAGIWPNKVVFASADQPLPPGPEWIRSQWEKAERLSLQQRGKSTEAVLLILDEVQKVSGWSETVKNLWDASVNAYPLQVILLGSSSLLLQKGMTESLSGRFFLYRCSHWTYSEMREAFGWSLDQWLYYGGYPGAAQLIDNEADWTRYVTDSLIETVLARDVLQMQTIAKPALLRNLFLLSCGHPAQVLSYTKMLGQLQDAGNTTTLAHYLKLLETAFLLSGLELFKKGKLKKRGSSPKLVIWNNALIHAVTGSTFKAARDDSSWWGRIVENAVGAHLMNHLSSFPYSVYYWRERNDEIDFVIESPRKVIAIEVKSGRTENTRGLKKFCHIYPEAIPFIVGPGCEELKVFFDSEPKGYLDLG